MAQLGINYAGAAPITLKAGGAITANRALKLDANGDVIVTTAITEDVIGVALQTVASGEYVEIMTVNGALVKLTTSAAVAIGAQLMPGASGKVATAAGATAKSFAQALTASSADGEHVMAVLRISLNGPANA
jgi:hypothetical protein